jgi:hypothetical protein
MRNRPCTFVQISLESNERKPLKSFGEGGFPALDPTDQVLVTLGEIGTGVVRVGKLSGGEPHVLFGHKEGTHNSIVVSPDGKWIAAGFGSKICLYPMPDLSRPAPHTLPHEQFLANLKSFTNLRVVRDSGSSTGWKLEVGPFPGWQKVPGW